MKSGIELIAARRKRQIESGQELMSAETSDDVSYAIGFYAKCRGDRIDALAIAGALCAAEIDRLQRIDSKG